jgi:aminoglycoside phosphotransferase family enzyme
MQKIQFEGLFQQAMEMEKDQIIDAHDAAYIAMNLAFRGFDRSLEYYEATYGS